MLAIKTHQLGHEFPGRRVLQDLHLEIPVGERVALLGPNGVGKTTLLRVLSTLQCPSEGEGWILGYSLKDKPEIIRRYIAWMPATDRGFLPHYTGFENLIFFGGLRGLDRKFIDQKVSPWLYKDSIKEALKTPFQRCSAGMKQSIALLRATLSDPDILFLDEPTRSLDASTSGWIYEFLKDTFRGKTILFSTHSQEEAASLGTQEIRLQRTCAP